MNSEAALVREEAIDVLRKASSGMIIDALAMAGIQGGIAGIRPARGFEDAKVVGPAATILYAPAHPGMPRVTNYQAIRATEPGSVLVIDGKGLDCHLTGDNQAAAARIQGIAAMVAFGGARDIAGWRQIDLPLYYLGSATRQPGSMLQCAGYNVPVEIGGVLVKPGDIIVADEDGVVAIPAEALDSLLENLKIVSSVEDAMEVAINNKASLQEMGSIAARKKSKL